MCDKTELIDSLDEPGEPITTVRSVYLPIQAQPGKMFIDAIGYEPPYVKTKDDVRRTIDTEIAKGAVVIKMLLDLPPITTGMLAEELVEETVRYAHEKGKLVSAHTTSVEAYRLAAKYGVDILNHTQWVKGSEAVILAQNANKFSPTPAYLGGWYSSMLTSAI